MKKNLLIFSMVITTGLFLSLKAQTDPGIVNLKHVWNFEDEYDASPNNPVDGVLMGDASLDGGALVTTTAGTAYAGDFISFSGEDLALNTYPEITFQTWVKAVTAPWNSMLFYFGDSTGGVGAKGVFATSISRAAISTYAPGTPWSGESSATGTDYSTDGGLDHQIVVTITESAITYYLDSVWQNSASMVTTNGTNTIADIGTQCAWIGRGGYSADPSWVGSVYQFTIYDKALTPAEIQFLFLQGKDVVPSLVNIASVNNPSDKHSVYIRNNDINIKSELTHLTDLEITVYNLLGKVCASQVVNSVTGSQHTVLNAEGLNNGIYIVKIVEDGKAAASYKLVK